ncbi:DUF808 domain-containing protein [Aestuariibacter halophilus]|uniref:DUF808 domain-containing protein n=1 Tax=Fluctibacter halophilus TaxID=226011 RepID=A0ABS8GAA7_9ALTE|nr:DUF808 domain-containing protein [Aestuariibacter halophilus]MCC2617343.1 DUF808 domain-containing protein [Aestuariibacter halophilus]
MAAANLLALLDDIATMLDDVAVLSKVAAKKTAGVLGDDLALNAEQVSGIRAERELPVVWAVAKGSFWNKVILVPSALLISAFVPVLIAVLMVIGGAYLCFEGAEKLLHRWLHSQQDDPLHGEKLKALQDPAIDLVALEKDKIKGAIRTDFILSAEIIVIVLGSVQDADFATQISVLAGLALAFTVGVYGLVAAIVKLDDMGLYLLRKSLSGDFNPLQRALGRGLLMTAPALMKSLTVIGTAAMFLVGGGLLVHNIEVLHHLVDSVLAPLQQGLPAWLHGVSGIVLEGLVGVLIGAFIALLVLGIGRLRGKSDT